MMPRRVIQVAVVVAALGCVLIARLPASSQQSPGAAAAAPAKSAERALLDRYCVGCHNERLKTAGLTLDRADVEHVDRNSELWEKVARKLRSREMPPAGSPRPAAAAYDAVIA